MVQNLEVANMKKSVKVVKSYDSADDALNSISERLAKKQLAMQTAQGMSVQDVMTSLNSKEKVEEQKKIYKKFFNEDEDGDDEEINERRKEIKAAHEARLAEA